MKHCYVSICNLDMTLDSIILNFSAVINNCKDGKDHYFIFNNSIDLTEVPEIYKGIILKYCQDYIKQENLIKGFNRTTNNDDNCVYNLCVCSINEEDIKDKFYDFIENAIGPEEKVIIVVESSFDWLFLINKILKCVIDGIICLPENISPQPLEANSIISGFVKNFDSSTLYDDNKDKCMKELSEKDPNILDEFYYSSLWDVNFLSKTLNKILII